jgi:D-ribulokinase
VSGWDSDFLRTIGLDDFEKEGFKRIGTSSAPIGRPVGKGLTAAAAADLGLSAGTAVATGIIDAHSGGIGMVCRCAAVRNARLCDGIEGGVMC